MQAHVRPGQLTSLSPFVFTAPEPREASIRIEGALDALTVGDVRAAIEKLVADRPMMVTVDVGGLTLLDSSGVGAIVWLFKQLKAQGGGMRVVGAHGQPLAVLKLLKLDAVFGC